MDRQIVYPGAIPLETDLLNTNKFAMIGLAKLASAMLGENTLLQGLACKPTAPPSMSIEVGEGQIYALEPVDGLPYSTLAADNTAAILKQGLNTAPRLFRLEAPGMPGQSINYLIQVAYGDRDTGPAVLPYYNAANPSVAFSGPDNSGAPQSTVRSGICQLTLKAGLAARTGDQKTPAADPGYTSAWVITVEYGALSVEESAIHIAESAPFIPGEGLINAIRQGDLSTGKATSEKDHYHLVCHPPVTKLHDGMRLFFRTTSTNTGPCTLRVSDLPAYPVHDNAAKEISKGMLSTCQQIEVEWNASLTAWILRNNLQNFDWDESDRRYIPVSGGEVKGPLKVDGGLSTDMPLRIGEAEVTIEGDISGKTWGGSLYSWLNARSASLKKVKAPLIWKDPVSKLIIQGGEHRSSGGKVAFPATFPANCFLALITQCDKQGKSIKNPRVSDIDINGFQLHAGHGETAFYWLAIGY